jgi:hypothetical protein
MLPLANGPDLVTGVFGVKPLIRRRFEVFM